MPQPLSSRHVKSFITHDVTTMRPELALAALRVVIAAAQADLALGRVLVAMSPKKARELAEHYTTQTADSQKRATIDAIAATHLTPDKLELFRRIVAGHNTAQKSRTPFAHWIYAYTPERDDLLILANPAKEIFIEADTAYIHHNWLDEKMN